MKASDTEDIKRMVKPFPEERTEIREVDNMANLKIAIDIQWLKPKRYSTPLANERSGFESRYVPGFFPSYVLVLLLVSMVLKEVHLYM